MRQLLNQNFKRSFQDQVLKRNAASSWYKCSRNYTTRNYDTRLNAFYLNE